MTYLPSGTALSGVTVAGTKELAEENLRRRGLSFQNTSNAPIRLTEDGTDAAADRGYLVEPGETFIVNTNRRVSIYCNTAGNGYAATEW